jgi:hypothetical protein
MSETSPGGEQAYKLHSDKKLGITVNNNDTGGQEFGLRAVRNLVRGLRGQEPLTQNPDARYGLKVKYEDGSYDTGIRAIKNTVRVLIGRPPVRYKRTMEPVK